MQGGLGSVVFGFIIWRLTGNLLLAAILSFVLWPLFQPLFGGSFSLPGQFVRWIRSLFEPDVAFITLSQSGVGQKKMRVLIIKQNQPVASSQEYENVYANEVKLLIDKFRSADDKRFDFKYKNAYCHYI